MCTYHSQNLALFLDEITDSKWLTHPAVQTFGLPGRLHSLEMTVPFISSVFLLEEGLSSSPDYLQLHAAVSALPGCTAPLTLLWKAAQHVLSTSQNKVRCGFCPEEYFFLVLGMMQQVSIPCYCKLVIR